MITPTTGLPSPRLPAQPTSPLLPAAPLHSAQTVLAACPWRDIPGVGRGRCSGDLVEVQMGPVTRVWTGAQLRRSAERAADEDHEPLRMRLLTLLAFPHLLTPPRSTPAALPTRSKPRWPGTGRYAGHFLSREGLGRTEIWVKHQTVVLRTHATLSTYATLALSGICRLDTQHAAALLGVTPGGP